MSIGLKHSTIETFRKRYHAGCTLKALALRDTGQSLELLATISTHFYLTHVRDTGEGAAPYQVVIDINHTAALTAAKMLRAQYFDLTNSAGAKQRFKVQTDAQPMIDEDRYCLDLIAAFGDAKPVT